MDDDNKACIGLYAVALLLALVSVILSSMFIHRSKQQKNKVMTTLFALNLSVTLVRMVESILAVWGVEVEYLPTIAGISYLFSFWDCALLNILMVYVCGMLVDITGGVKNNAPRIRRFKFALKIMCTLFILLVIAATVLLFVVMSKPELFSQGLVGYSIALASLDLIMVGFVMYAGITIYFYVSARIDGDKGPVLKKISILVVVLLLANLYMSAIFVYAAVSLTTTEAYHVTSVLLSNIAFVGCELTCCLLFKVPSGRERQGNNNNNNNEAVKSVESKV